MVNKELVNKAIEARNGLSDWGGYPFSPSVTWEKVREELAELDAEVRRIDFSKEDVKTDNSLRKEIGDVLFTFINFVESIGMSEDLDDCLNMTLENLRVRYLTLRELINFLGLHYEDYLKLPLEDKKGCYYRIKLCKQKYDDVASYLKNRIRRNGL